MFSLLEPDAAVLDADAVQAKVVSGLGGVLVEGWRYIGYRLGRSPVDRTKRILKFRFEKPVAGRLAAADVTITETEFSERRFPVSDFFSSRLRAVEPALLASAAALLH